MYNTTEETIKNIKRNIRNGIEEIQFMYNTDTIRKDIYGDKEDEV